MSSGSASHRDPPPGLSDGAQGCRAVAFLRVGTFNCGIHQEMLTIPRHQKLRRIITNALYEGACHVLAFCEVGGHDLGFGSARIVPSSIVKDVLPNDRCTVAK